jgi:hypothetical protein
MKRGFLCLLAFTLFTAPVCSAGEVHFADDFKGKLGEGWSWIREHREGWRLTERGLEVRVQPGNMWGPANDAKMCWCVALPTLRKPKLKFP